MWKPILAALAVGAFFVFAAPAWADSAHHGGFFSKGLSSGARQTTGALDLTPTPANPPVPAASVGVLHRGLFNVHFDGSFTGLRSNTAYSLWWGIFNRPQQCTDPCDFDDVNNGVGQSFNAGSFISDAEGAGDASAFLPVGRIPRGVGRVSDDVMLAAGRSGEVGLRRPFGALIVVVVRQHGAPNAANIGDQTSTFFGACPGGVGCSDDQVFAFAPALP